jgi:hypothetical protein
MAMLGDFIASRHTNGDQRDYGGAPPGNYRGTATKDRRRTTRDQLPAGSSQRRSPNNGVGSYGSPRVARDAMPNAVGRSTETGGFSSYNADRRRSAHDRALRPAVGTFFDRFPDAAKIKFSANGRC